MSKLEESVGVITASSVMGTKIQGEMNHGR
jgi:hypothetical protein